MVWVGVKGQALRVSRLVRVLLLLWPNPAAGPCFSQPPRALAPRALTPRALTPRALAPMALAPRALIPRALAPRALTPALEATRGGRSAAPGLFWAST